MKMKKWLAVSMTALAVTAGSMVVSADSLTLSGGEVLDMGSSVSVYPGERSFFGSQLHECGGYGGEGAGRGFCFPEG